jgi:prolyl-tRNA synthetase
MLQVNICLLEEVHTPGKKTIEEVSDLMGIKPSQTLKAVVYMIDDNELVMAVIRGDLDVNETKLRNYLGTRLLVMPGEDELTKAGIVPGYASPVGSGVRVIVDQSVASSSNLVSGANRIDYHVANVNFGRDFSSDDVADISAVSDGEKCPECGGSLTVKRGIEIGNIFKLGTKYSDAMKASYLDVNGKEQKMIMGCYGIGVGRLLASALEIRGDDRRIVWPISIAPFEVELVGLAIEKDDRVRSECEKLYNSLVDVGVEVLFDDRKASPGFKFNDADLIGSPIRVTIGAKSLEKGGAEVTVGGKREGDSRA